MNFFKRIVLFMAVNMLIVLTITIVTSLLGIGPYLQRGNLNLVNLMAFCLVWGFGGAFISLALSRIMAKWMMGVKVIDVSQGVHRLTGSEAWLVQKVYDSAKRAGLTTMPEVGIYESPDLNAFATGPTRNRALVAVSSGLLQRMSEDEVEGVIAHEVAHVANGDMVTMTLIQGVVNAFVMFLARVIGWAVSQAVEEQRRPMIQFIVVFLSEMLLGILGMMVVASFSRYREYRADAGGAKFAGTHKMIAALRALKANMGMDLQDDQPAIASMKISGKPGNILRLFSTHPDLDDRIAALERAASGRKV